jgi:hypothetical protein
VGQERITFQTRRDVSPETILTEVKKAEEQNAKVSALLRTVEGKIELKINFDGPIRLLPISDMHLFAPETDNQKVDEILNKLDEENTYGIMCGDFIEGVHVHISEHTGKIHYTFGEQLEIAQKRIEPYVKKGKILCMVGWYDGHEGWAEKQATIEALRVLSNGLIQPDGSKIQSLFNGGRLEIKLSNGQDFILKLFHDAGGGGSDNINPLGSQRNAAWDSSKLNSPDRIDGVIAGHQHHRAGTSKELTYDKLTGEEKSEVFLALGTTKGNDAEHADRYLISQGKGPTLPPGGSIVLNQIKNEKDIDRFWPTYGYDKGQIIYDAAKVWDNTEKQGVTKELLTMVEQREGAPKAEFDRRNSRTRTVEDNTKAPFFETFRWKIRDGNLPVLVYLLANARYGSESGKRDRAKLLEVYNQVVNDPFKYVLAMRHFVDNNVAKAFDRRNILDAVVNDLKGVREVNSLLGFMLSSTLRTDQWTKDVTRTVKDSFDRRKKEWNTHKEVNEGFIPGNYLYKKSAIAGTPLYGNDSLMILSFKNAEYVFQLLDHLSWSGSEFDMFRGLVQSQRKSRLQLDVVTGGHMPGAGVMTTPNGVAISTGWYSDYDSRGKANIKRAPLGGQGVILFPDKKMVIPAATFLEATDLHTALILNAGLTPEEKTKLSEKTK